MPDIFISYSTKDETLAERLVNDLRREGISVWFDRNEILVGHSIVDKVYDGIRACRFLALVLTSQSVRSKWVQEELSQAKTREIESGSTVVLPLLFEDCDLPAAVSTKRYADFRKDYKRGLAEVCSAITLHSSKKAEIHVDLRDYLHLKATDLARDWDTLIKELPDEEIDEGAALLNRFSALETRTRDCIGLLVQMLDGAPNSLHKYDCLLGQLFSAYVSDFNAELRFVEAFDEREKHYTVETLLTGAVAAASAGNLERATVNMRVALRRLWEVDPPRDQVALEDALWRFIYSLTAHVRRDFIHPTYLTYRDRVLFRDKSKLRDRLAQTIDLPGFFGPPIPREPPHRSVWGTPVPSL